MSEISEKVLKTIEKKQITPKARWFFVLKNYIIWIFSAVFIIFGSLSVSTILFILTTHDWDVYDYLGRSFFEHVLISIPYLWIFIFSLLILIAYYDFVHTKYGYRYAVFHIFIGIIVSSLILGTILFCLGVDSEIHEAFSKNVPFYNNLIYYKEDIWNRPEKGLLAGEVVDIKDKNEFVIKDFQGKIWHITGDNIIWPDGIMLQKGIKIKIIGKKQSNDIFYGRIIRPW